MKKRIAIVCLALLLSGCGKTETFETVADEWVQQVMAEPASVSLYLPPEAATPVLESGEGAVYDCGEYAICRQDLPAGDLSATVQSVTGYSLEELTMLETKQGDAKRYDFVWVSASEEGEQVGKGCILDDGNYHYVVTVLGDADTANDYQEVWQDILSSFSLDQY